MNFKIILCILLIITGLSIYAAVNLNKDKVEVSYIDLSNALEITEIDSNAFSQYKGSVDYILLPKTVSRISKRAFSGLKKVNFVAFHDHLESIDDEAFVDANIEYITVVRFTDRLNMFDCSESNIMLNYYYSDLAYRKGLIYDKDKLLDDNTYNPRIKLKSGELVDLWSYFESKYTSINGILYSFDGTELIYYPNLKKDVVFQVPSTVKRIGKAAFQNNKNLKRVRIPENVSYSKEAFKGTKAEIIEIDSQEIL